MKLQLSLPHKLSYRLILLVLIPLTFELGFFGTFGYLQYRTERFAAFAEKSRAVSSSINSVIRTLYAAGVLAMQPSEIPLPELQERVGTLMRTLKQSLSNLSEMTADNPEQRESMQRVLLLMRAGYKTMAHLHIDTTSPANETQSTWRQEPIRVVNRIIKELTGIEEKEEELEAKYREHWRFWKDFQSKVLVGGVIASIILTLAITQAVYLGVIKRLSVISRNTRRLADDAELEFPLSGDDEISIVDHSFHEMAERLAEAKRKEKAAETLRREFVAMITHDLKTPLASQKFFLSTIADRSSEQSKAQLKEQAVLLESDMERLLNMINNLLDFEKMDAGKLKVSISSVALNDVLQRSLIAVTGLLQAKSLSIIQKVDSGVFVEADKDRLIQVMVNLLSNASKCSPKGSAITISTQRIANHWEIAITDKGPGVPPEFASRAFERFEQSDSDKANGSGLGLHICKSLIEAQGGKVGFRPGDDGGTSFWLILQVGENPN
ncbi:MAG: hypothetical protein C5B53_00540 [Candidatus Melainabacteria bacterium]|nr:MAG: hypothetical protein C5B53_00540 [Candidatus Melainabacteria bacterium]